MEKLADGLLSGDFSQRPADTSDQKMQQLDSKAVKETVKQPGIAPRMFKTFITSDHAEFRSSRQQVSLSRCLREIVFFHYTC